MARRGTGEEEATARGVTFTFDTGMLVALERRKRRALDRRASPSASPVCGRTCTTVPGRVLRCFRRTVVSQVERRAEKLLRHRHIGEQRQLRPTDGVQRLIWLDGEALCVTPELHAALSRQAGNTASTTLPNTGSRSAPALATLSGPFQATLVRPPRRWPLRWFWNWLRGKHLMSRELHQAGLLFRLQRYGVGDAAPARLWPEAFSAAANGVVPADRNAAEHVRLRGLAEFRHRTTAVVGPAQAARPTDP